MVGGGEPQPQRYPKGQRVLFKFHPRLALQLHRTLVFLCVCEEKNARAPIFFQRTAEPSGL